MSTPEERLQDAIGLIDDDYIREAHVDENAASADDAASTTAHVVTATATSAATATSGETAPSAANGAQTPASKRKQRSIARPLALAACLVLAAGIGLFAMMNVNSTKPATDTAEKTFATHSEAASDEPAAVADAEADSAKVDSKMETEGLVDGATSIARETGDSTTSDIAPAPRPDFTNRPAGEANVLTAGVWDDNSNWPFFTNLVNAGTIGFPAYGIDPTHRIKVTVTDAAGNALRNEPVQLRDESGAALWDATTDKNGIAYLFFRDGQVPATAVAGGVEQPLTTTADNPEDRQGAPIMRTVDDVTIAATKPTGVDVNGLQVMFIVDTTGSMTDEIAYLQADFAKIAGDVGSDGVTYSVNFYRDAEDEYVTKCNDFTSDVSHVQNLLNNEYATGGGDTPEAVADILQETITNNGQWKDDCGKIAFLIFDAPPHDGTEPVIDAAVRSAAERGIALVPVVASNAERDTELFGRAMAICTNGTYVFLTDDSGVGDSHLEPIVGDYSVELLHDIIVRLINDAR